MDISYFLKLMHAHFPGACSFEEQTARKPRESGLLLRDALYTSKIAD